MVAATYTFTGQSQLGYYAYSDVSTGRMLVAEPGESYQIRACEQGLAVPPPDGRWVAAADPHDALWPAAETEPEPPVTVPAEPEGAEA